MAPSSTADRVPEWTTGGSPADTPAHSLTAEESLELLGTDRTRGLAQDEARRRLERFRRGGVGKWLGQHECEL